jgi:hypothetical protein
MTSRDAADRLAISLVVILMTALSVDAQRADEMESVQDGDLVIAAVLSGGGVGPLPTTSFVEVRHPSGARKFAAHHDFYILNVLPAAGEIYVGGHASISTVSPSLLRTSTTSVGNTDVLDFAIDAAGRVYSLGATGSVFVVAGGGPSPQPTHVADVPVPARHGLWSGDLHIDQCTLYYVAHRSTTGSILKRYDLCNGVALPDVPIDLSCTNTNQRPVVRVARDGSVVVSACSKVFHISSAGTRTYRLGADHISEAMALDPDGMSFWSLSTVGLIEMDFATGTAVLRGPPATLPMFGGMAFIGAPRSAVLAPVAIPTSSRLVLLLFMAAVATIAVMRIGA